jgi:hypothetical protein
MMDNKPNSEYFKTITKSLVSGANVIKIVACLVGRPWSIYHYPASGFLGRNFTPWDEVVPHPS